jgi:hypothetical protein
MDGLLIGHLGVEHVDVAVADLAAREMDES